MDKRYQVFVSSTFLDLQDERQSVLRAILELDQMPAGMELFPAADESAWELIRDVIDSSDYYVLIIGGRYGSTDDEGIGYTEKEYDYAIESGRPVVALLHQNPNELPREKTETDRDVWQQLESFRAKVEERHTCSYWSSAPELKSQVIIGLTTAMKRSPQVGWVRADEVPTGAAVADVLTLRDRIAELEAEAAADRSSPPAGTEEFAQGDDETEIEVRFRAYERGDLGFTGTSYTLAVMVTWSELFAAVAPTLLDEATDRQLRRAIEEFVGSTARVTLAQNEEFKERSVDQLTVNRASVDTCIVQFRALGLFRESTRKRSVTDKGQYWSLTPYGDTLMTLLRAIRRPGVAVDEKMSGTEHATSQPTGTETVDSAP